MLKAFKWQQKNPKHALNDWTNGAYYIGVTKAYQATGNKAYQKGLIAMAEELDWMPAPRWYHADDIAISQSYLYMKEDGVKGANLQPTVNDLDKVMTQEYDWKDENGIKPIYWWWCDALFMGPPVFVHYAAISGENKYLTANDRLYNECYELLFDQEEHLFARDMRYLWEGDKEYLKEANGKKIFWSRGNGWVIGGLALLLQQMPADYEKRGFYEDLFKKMASKLKAIQPEDGMWRSSLLDPESYPHGEVSGTGFDTFAFLWGINNGLLDRSEYLPAAMKAFNGLMACQQADGKMGWVQPIGADPKRNFSADSWEVYGTGAYLLAASEMLKLEE
ncbi:MAG: glycoside hydrolase family 88 protein [Cyclobacteriaceae bacterium]|nr:glycoside hydrolase family 88 protein [Cyclobacteriaceae bacterium]